jgi:hypothetical protein
MEHARREGLDDVFELYRAVLNTHTSRNIKYFKFNKLFRYRMPDDYSAGSKMLRIFLTDDITKTLG